MALHVSHKALTAGQESIQKKATLIEKTLRDLESEMNKRKPRFTGEAAEAYRVAALEWNDAMNNLRLLLLEVAASVGQANEGYMEADRASSQGFGSR